MPTKKELEEQIVSLKDMLKKANDKLKETINATEPDLGDNPYRAIGLFKKDKVYKFARIDYNPSTGACKIFSMADASRVPEAAHMAEYNLEEVITEEIIKRLREEDA